MSERRSSAGWPARPEVTSPPPNISTLEEKGGLTITHSWRSKERIRLVALMAVGLLGISFIITLTLMVLGEITPSACAIINIGVLDGVVVLAFLLLTSNTVVRVTPETIRVRHRRHVLPQRYRIGVADLDQLFCVRVHAQVGAARMYRFHLVALERNGRRIILVPNLEHRTEALYLERLIERNLGIIDRPVRGELGKEAPTLARRDLQSKYFPSWRWGVLMKTFMAKSPFHRIKIFREDEAMYVKMHRRERARVRRHSTKGSDTSGAPAADPDDDVGHDAGS